MFYKNLNIKQKLTYIFILISLFSFSQDLSYGILIGGVGDGVSNNNGHFNFTVDTPVNLNVGAYVEVGFTNKLGLKTEITFNTKDPRLHDSSSTIYKLSYLEIAPNFKYDFGDEYREGIYMLIGPKIGLLTKADSEGEDVKDAFESTIFTGQIGVGYRVLTFMDLELKGDFDLSPFVKDNDYKSSFFGGYLSVTIDIERILNK